MANEQNEWGFRCIITDDREEINPTVRDVINLQTKIQRLNSDFVITLDKKNEEIINVRFINWLKYISFNQAELSQIVDFASEKYTDEKRDELEMIMTNLARRNNLPLPNTMKESRYNILLGSYARNRVTAERLQYVINSDPSSICYLEGSEQFRVCRALGEKGIFKVPQIETNLISKSVVSTYIQFFPLSEYNINELFAMLGKVYSTTHVTWHQNVPHFFVYSDPQTMLQHIVDKLLESDIIYMKIKSGQELQVSRVSERLVVLNGDDKKKAQRLSAIGILNAELLDYNDLPNKSVDAFMKLADDLYYSNNPVLKNNYDRAYLNCTGKMLWTEAEQIAHNDLINRRGILSIPTEVFKIDGYMTPRIGSLYRQPVELRTTIPYVYDELEMINGHQEKTYESVPAEYVTTRTMSPSIYDTYILTATISEKPTSEQKVEIGDNEKQIGENRSLCQLAGIMNANFRNTDVLSRLFSNMRNEYKSLSVLELGSVEHLLYYYLFQKTKDDLIKIQSNEFVPDIEHAKERKVNNSTFKLLTIYMRYINSIQSPDVSKENQNYFFENNKTIIILGAEEEPLIGILNDFHSRTIARGYGNIANMPNIRVTVPFPADMSVYGDLVISDIDQSIIKKYTQTAHSEVVMPLIKSCFKIAKRGYFKLNILTRRIINEITDMLKELCATPIIEIVRTIGQNMYTQEVFIEYDITDSERSDSTPYFGEVTPMMNEIIEMYDGNMTKTILTPLMTKIPKVSEIDLDESRLFAIRVGNDKIREALALLSQYATSVNTRRVNDDDDDLIITGKLDYRRLTMTRRALRIDQNYKLSTTDYDKYMPNGFGVSSRKETLAYSRMLSTFTIFKEVTYKTVLDTILGLENIEKVVCIGSRNLTELTAIPTDLKMVAYDKMTTDDERLDNLDIEVINEWWDYVDMPFEDNTVYLFLYVIPNSHTGLYRSEIEQINLIKRMCEVVNGLNNTHVFVNYYSDAYTDVAETLTDIPNFYCEDQKFMVFDYIAQIVRTSELMENLSGYVDMLHEKRLNVEQVYEMMIDQGLTCSQEYVLLRSYMQEWYKLLHIKKS